MTTTTRDRIKAWSLREANAAELKAVGKRIREFGLATTTASLVALAGGMTALTASGFGAATPLVALAIMSVNLATIWVIRSHWRRPLEESVVVGTWMARNGLIDAEGRLTPTAKELIASTDASSIGPTSVIARNSSGSELASAVRAYEEARELHQAGKPWTPPLTSFSSQIDTREVRDYLTREARQSGR